MPRLTREPKHRQKLRRAYTTITYHEVETSPGKAFEVDHAEGAQILPLGGEPIGGGATGGGWLFKYALIEPAVVIEDADGTEQPA